MGILQVLAPFDGWCTALDAVPDPVFSKRMLGDGLAIDPVGGIVRAPCAGEIVTLPAGGHAVALRTQGGIEVLVHVGIDTVQLGGRGFEVLVRPRALVQAGDVLIRFDLDMVARGAKSLMTPVIVTSAGDIELRKRRPAGTVATGDVLFEVYAAASGASGRSEAPANDDTARRTMTVKLRHGLHARPAALLAQRAKSFAARLTVTSRGRGADARSAIAIMTLGVAHGDAITIEARGADAARAVDEIAACLEEALRNDAPAIRGDAAQRAEDADRGRVCADDSVGRTGDGVLRGVPAAPGFAVGSTIRLKRGEIPVVERGQGIALESAALAHARDAVGASLSQTAGATGREIAAAHIEFLGDPLVDASAQQLIAAGKSAAFAWRSAIRRQIAALEALTDEHVRERADDLRDLESQVLLALTGDARPAPIALPDRAVLIADDLLPSELNALDRGRMEAICLSRGGATSHVAILAAASGMPMLIGLGSSIRDLADGTTVIVDADQGRLHTSPDSLSIASARAQMDRRIEERVALRAAAQTPCRTRDGTRIEVFANLGSVADAVAAVDNGAEGCGLLRTEFLFIDRQSAPTEIEQLEAYQAIADALGPRPLVLRLMDIGGDKPLRYLPMPAEDNPALGLRGVRAALMRPDLLRTQLRAALRVIPSTTVRLLVPMVTDLAEVEAVRGVIDELAAELGIGERIELGAMIETPAAALIAASLLRAVDFLSIGSNDLTQYTLAMDRGHPELAGRADPMHPAVLRLIAAAAAAAADAGKIVAVCGAIAADAVAAPILIGLGVNELSVVPSAVPAVKALVRTLTVGECRTLARRCLEFGSAAEVRAFAAQKSPRTGDPR